MSSQEIFNRLNRARIYLLSKKDYDAVCLLDRHIFYHFQEEEENDFKSGDSVR